MPAYVRVNYYEKEQQKISFFPRFITAIGNQYRDAILEVYNLIIETKSIWSVILYQMDRILFQNVTFRGFDIKLDQQINISQVAKISFISVHFEKIEVHSTAGAFINILTYQSIYFEDLKLSDLKVNCSSFIKFLNF